MIDETTALLHHLQKRVQALEAILAERDARIAELEAEVAELREELGRDSRNSSRPPSSDPPEARAKRKARLKKGTRKRGGQNGHKGHHRKLVPPDQVDEFVDVYPTRCGQWGEDLPQVAKGELERHQVVEVPPVRPRITEYRTYETDCPCCGATSKAGVGSNPSS